MDTADPKSPNSLAGWGTIVLQTLLPVAALGGGNAIAPLAALAGLLATPLRGWRSLVAVGWPWALPLLGFVLYAAISVIWSPAADSRQGYRLVAGVVFGLLLAAGLARMPEDAVKPSAFAIVGGAILFIGLGLIEALLNMPLNRLAQPDAIDWVLARNPGKGISVFSVIIWPAVVIGATAFDGRFRMLAFGLLAGAGYLTLQFDQATNALAFLAGALAAITALILGGSFAVRAVFLAAAAWLISAPLVAGAIGDLIPSAPFSVEHRFAIWHFAAEQALQQPLFGHGLDAARTISETGLVQGVEAQLMPLHPHSISLQVWLELGMVGVGLAALALGTGGWLAGSAIQRQKTTAAAVAGSAAAFAVLANLSYGAWQEWWVATAIIAAANSIILWRYMNQTSVPDENFAFIVA